MDLPISFEEKIKQLLKEEYSDYIDCYQEPRRYGLRVNTTKISAKEFQKICPFKIQPIPWIENGFYYDGELETPAKHPYYFAGLYYLQEPSAMTPANRLPIMPHDKVLDLCAAPGGKATELGAKLSGTGMLVANDISNSRAKGLLKNLELFGVPNMLVLSEEPKKIASYFPQYFDKILIDAPCSGEGMFRKDKKMIRSWEAHGPQYFAEIQREIIIEAAGMLKPGGMILYSTCTFDPIENEGIIAYLMQEYPMFRICELAPYEGFTAGNPAFIQSDMEDLCKTVRIWPHKMPGEGHYLALLKKGEAAEKEQEIALTATIGTRKLSGELETFFREISWELETKRIQIQGEKVYYLPSGLPNLKGIRFLRTGLYLGELKKNRFEPSQALAMCLKKEDYPRVIDFPSEDVRVMKYLKGETLEVSDLTDHGQKGWFLIAVDGFPLGWGKLQNGTLKNKYYSGWRSMA